MSKQAGNDEGNESPIRDNIDEALSTAMLLHPGMTEKNAKDEEISRRLATQATTINITQLLAGYLLAENESDRADNERCLNGELSSLVEKTLSGHGTQTQGLNNLIFKEIILDQSFRRMEDRYDGYKRPQVLTAICSDCVSISFNRLNFYPKHPEYETEDLGYYQGNITLTKDVDTIKSVMEEAKAIHKLLQAKRIAIFKDTA